MKKDPSWAPGVADELSHQSSGSGDPAGTVRRYRVVKLPPESNIYFPFDLNEGLGYVWHCHIIDHEDNEMMRPDDVDTLGSSTNSETPSRT